MPSHPLLEFQSPKKLPVAAAKTSFLGAQEGWHTGAGLQPSAPGDKRLDLGGLARVSLHPVQVPEPPSGTLPILPFLTNSSCKTLSERPLNKQTLESSRCHSKSSSVCWLVCPQMSNFTSLSLSFLFCKTGTIIPTSKGCSEDRMSELVRMGQALLSQQTAPKPQWLNRANAHFSSHSQPRARPSSGSTKAGMGTEG